MHPRCASGFVPLLLAAALAAQEEPVPVLDRGTFAALWQHVVPKDDELAWQRIPWHGTLAAGVVQAHTTDRPILLWVMNGHPLACT
jgi:hypothetical protein